MLFIESLAHDIALNNTNISVDEIKSFIARCKVWRYEWGAIMAHQNDMHLHVLTSHRKMVFLRPAIRKAIHETFKQYDTLTTSVSKDKQFKLMINYFVMGWKLDHETESAWHLIMKKDDFKYG